MRQLPVTLDAQSTHADNERNAHNKPNRLIILPSLAITNDQRKGLTGADKISVSIDSELLFVAVGDNKIFYAVVNRAVDYTLVEQVLLRAVRPKANDA